MTAAPLREVAQAWPAGVTAAVFVFGLLIGSFLNVVIARVPQRRSLWRPRSACPGCGSAIAWYDNVPVLSFALLRGRCRSCGAPISWRYPIVELVTASLLAVAYVAFGPTADFVVAAILLAALVAIAAIDLQHQLIPDAITLPGVVVGFVANVATGRLPWLECVAGILLGGGLFFVIIVVSPNGMGGGDMKLGAMLGAFLGWKALAFALFTAVVLGGAVALALLAVGRRGRKDRIPFGPFLALAGAMSLFWGERIFTWYVGGFSL